MGEMKDKRRVRWGRKKLKRYKIYPGYIFLLGQQKPQHVAVLVLRYMAAEDLIRLCNKPGFLFSNKWIDKQTFSHYVKGCNFSNHG